MEIYDVLKKDHADLKGLLNKLVTLDKDSKDAPELIEEIKEALVPHSRAEEAVFYNSLREASAGKGIVMHSYQEHVEAEATLQALKLKEKIDADWKTTALNLKKAIEHHISEEETKVFAAAKNVFTPAEARQLAVAFEKMKAEVQEQSIVGTTLDLIVNLMPPRFSKSLGVNKANFISSKK